MSALDTCKTLWRQSRVGSGSRNRILCFLLSGLGCLGGKRRFLRKVFPWLIGRFAENEQVCVQFEICGRQFEFWMRRGDREDYLIAGELIRGGYKVPDQTPDQIIDGGANIGAFAIQACNAFPGVDLFCFEPDDANLKQLRRNLDRNGIDARVHGRALWSSAQQMYFRRESSYSGFLASDPPGHPVECCELPRISRNCWLKLDIEGAEYEVLPALFKRNEFPRWISLELHRFAERGQELLAALLHHGYRISGGGDPAAECCVIEAVLEK